MAAPTISNLRKAVKKGEFPPVILLYGDDEFRKDALVREIADAAVEPATRDFNLDVLRGAETNPETLGSLLHTPPMMADRRMIVVRDVGSLKKDSRVVLEAYLKHPAPEALLVLTLTAGGTNDLSPGESVLAVEVGALKGAERAQWIDERIIELGGAGITPAAREVLENAVDTSGGLATELDKLVSYSAGKMIERSAVEDVVGLRENGTLGAFLDRVAERNTGAALALVDDLLAHARNTLVSVVMALTAQCLALSWGRSAKLRGLPDHQLEREFFRLLKETGAHPMRPWGEAVRTWSRHVARWDVPSLRHALATLRVADQAAKDSRYSREEQLLSNVVVQLCGSGKKAAA
jgi:DNA polymerase III subunit delta